MFEALEDVISLLQHTISQRIADQAGLALVSSQDATAQAKIDQALLDAKSDTAAALAAQQEVVANGERHLVEVLHSLSDAALQAAGQLHPAPAPPPVTVQVSN